MKTKVTVDGCKFFVHHYDGNTVVRPARGEGEPIEYRGTVPAKDAASAYLHGYDPDDSQDAAP